MSWGKRNYVNPPFSEIPIWIEKGLKELEKGKLSVFLIPVRSGQLYWKNLIFPNASEIRFICGRIKFDGFDRGLPIPICVVVFDPKKKPSIKYVERTGYSYYSCK